SLMRLAGPLSQRLMPRGVRNRYGIVKVTTPWPKWLWTRGSRGTAGAGATNDTTLKPCGSGAAAPAGGSNSRYRWALSGPPFQYAVKLAGQGISQPAWLAMVSGRQR